MDQLWADMDTVLVEIEGRWVRRSITTGVHLPEGHVEVLSGLASGDTVGLGESE